MYNVPKIHIVFNLLVNQLSYLGRPPTCLDDHAWWHFFYLKMAGLHCLGRFGAHAVSPKQPKAWMKLDVRTWPNYCLASTTTTVSARLPLGAVELHSLAICGKANDKPSQ